MTGVVTYAVAEPAEHLVEWLRQAHDDGAPPLVVTTSLHDDWENRRTVSVSRAAGSALSATEALEVLALVRAHAAEPFLRGPGLRAGAVDARRFVTSESDRPITILEMARLNAEDPELATYIAELSALEVGESCSLGMFITWTRIS